MSSLVRGKWIERDATNAIRNEVLSSLVRGKWIERQNTSMLEHVPVVFPREREVD